MRVSGLDDRQIDNYFSDMLTKEGMLPYIEGAEQQGYYKGFDEGEAKGRAEVAKALLDGGMSIEMVAGYTGLSTEQIEELKARK